jgi:hypothetical protein
VSRTVARSAGNELIAKVRWKCVSGLFVGSQLIG